MVRSLFARARACSPCVLFIDEIDALVGARSFGGGGGGGGDVVQGRVLASFLTEMDGISAGDGGVVLVGATNRLEVCHHASLLQKIITPRTHSHVHVSPAVPCLKGLPCPLGPHTCQCIDAALLRPGRFDIKVCSVFGSLVVIIRKV